MTAAPAADQLADLYDHEVAALIRVEEALRQRYAGGMRNYGAFEREAESRFAEAGFRIKVDWYEYSVSGVPQEGAMPEITIMGRIEVPAAFDHDRQVFEATRNVLGIPGEEGVIKTDPETLKRFLGEQQGSHGHGGHGHSH